jgi:RNA polymerase sigma-70 factor, ECF subfamily
MGADPAVFLPLYTRHQGELYGFLLTQGLAPDAADDVLQEASVALWEDFGSYQPGTDFRAWAFAILRFRLLRHRDQLVRAGRCLPLDPATAESLAAASIAADPLPGRDQIATCLGSLGEHARRLLSLRYDDGLSTAAIAAHIGSTDVAVRTRLSRLRAVLADCLRRQEALT